MTNKNICKFSTPLISDSLYISQFIFETEEETMKKTVSLNENRMYLISKGKGKMEINTEEVSFQAGELIFGFKDEKVRVTEINKCEFMYIDFETVYKWIRKHRAKIDAIVFDPFAKYDYAWYIGVGDFIKQIEVLKKVLKSYQGKNIISDLRTVSIQKHMPK